jgi:hypothetical protein
MLKPGFHPESHTAETIGLYGNMSIAEQEVISKN